MQTHHQTQVLSIRRYGEKVKPHYRGLSMDDTLAFVGPDTANRKR